MRGDPRSPRPEAEISNNPPPRIATPDAAAPVSRSRHPRPQVLMGEVIGPRGKDIGAGREALRAFMRARHLAPTRWCADAGVPMGELLAYLTGRTRHLAPATLEKLAAVAGVTPDAMFRG